MAGKSLSSRTLWGYALPGLAIAIPTIPVYVMIPSYYADTLGLGLALVGTVLLAVRLLDMVTDPVIGLLSDQVRIRIAGHRFGRRKPWILAGALLAGLGLCFLFAPPAGAGPWYLGLWSAVLYLGWTLFAVPYYALAAEITPDYEARTALTTRREALFMTGVLLAASAPAVGEGLGLARGETLFWTALAGIGAGALVLLPFFRLVPDPVRKTRENPLTRQDLQTALASRPFLVLLGAWLLNGIANGLPPALLPLFLDYRIGADGFQKAMILAGYFGAGVLGMPLWSWMAGRMGKHTAWIIAMGFASVIFSFTPLLGMGDFIPFLVISLLTGLALGADLALPPAMQADVVDDNTLRTGREQAGAFFALWSMGVKLALALAVFVGFAGLDLAGFETEKGANQDTFALAALYAWATVAFKIAAIILIMRYPIDRDRHQLIRKRLGQRKDQ